MPIFSSVAEGIGNAIFPKNKYQQEFMDMPHHLKNTETDLYREHPFHQWIEERQRVS